MRVELNRAFIKEFCGYIENGITQRDAALMCGISEACLYKWLGRGKQEIELGIDAEDSIYVELVESLKRSEPKFKAYHIQQIHKASRDLKQWQASAWLLERKYPREFGKVDRNAVQAEDDNGQLRELAKLFKQREEARAKGELEK